LRPVIWKRRVDSKAPFILTLLPGGDRGGTCGTRFEPCLDEGAELRLRAGYRRAIAARVPGQTDKLVHGHVMEEFRPGHVQAWVKSLPADLARLPAPPGHLDQGELLLGLAGHGRRHEVSVSVTGRAPQGPRVINT